MSGHVGPGGVSVNSERAASAKREILEIERLDREKVEKPIREAIEREGSKLARAAGAVQQESLRYELQCEKYRLTHESSPDWSCTAKKYDGRFHSAAEVTNGIQKAYEHFKSRTDDGDCQLTKDFLMNNFNDCDTSDPSVWESAYQYVISRLSEISHRYDAPPEPVAEPEPEGEFAAHDNLLKSLYDELAAVPPSDSRRRSAIEAKILREEVRRETVGNSEFRNVMLEIASDSGLIVQTSVAEKFLVWLQSPAAREFRPLMKSDYRSGIRQAFSVFTGMDDRYLTAEEKQRAANRRDWAAASSEDVKKAVGYTASYGYDSGRRV